MNASQNNSLISTMLLTLLVTGVTVYAGAAALLEAPSVPDEMISELEGVWYGEENSTPFGVMPFAMNFEWEEDGSLHSHSALSKETWIDLRFHKSETGGWLLTESAALAGQGEQMHTLHPVRVAGDTSYWAYLEKPEYLSIKVAVEDDNMLFLVNLRGEEHARFLLSRAEGEVADEIRISMKASAEDSGEKDWERLREGTGEDNDPVEIQNARVKVKSEPDNAQAYLELGMALSEVVSDAPMPQKAAYAQEMLASFQKAVEVDPTLPDARFGLAQYYLGAPPIAGGSLEKAAAQGEALRELKSPLGEVVLADVDARGGDTEAAVARLKAVLENHPDLEPARRLYIQLAGASQDS